MYYFIGGFARTGTTLMEALLCGDPRVNPLMAEITYVEYLMVPYEAFAQGWKENYKGLFKDREQFQDFHKSLLEKFFDHLKEMHQCERLVMKRPFLTRWFPLFATWWPEAQFIIMVRDPRDVAGSLKRIKKKHEKRSLKEQAQYHFLDQSLTDMVYAYVNSIKLCTDMAKQFGKRFHFVKYEELVTRPEAAMKYIGKALDLELGLDEEEWLEQGWSPTNPFHSTGWGKPITDKNIGNYKHQLDQEELDMVEMVASFLMEVFDYE